MNGMGKDFKSQQNKNILAIYYFGKILCLSIFWTWAQNQIQIKQNLS